MGLTSRRTTVFHLYTPFSSFRKHVHNQLETDANDFWTLFEYARHRLGRRVKTNAEEYFRCLENIPLDAIDELVIWPAHRHKKEPVCEYVRNAGYAGHIIHIGGEGTNTRGSGAFIETNFGPNQTVYNEIASALDKHRQQRAYTPPIKNSRKQQGTLKRVKVSLESLAAVS